ncbi:hypothetical protein [Pantoea sp. SOD02]|uniref:hypothetical protein n=1 Tax=Pantoea sp. SOD02 TaxID=2970818 RepID=UPI002157AA70|nr:hypothetical protein [Pantoea sp. SOD02]UVC32049.1 hypothetical protein NR302_21015 [Pantoea sp. SOD02]
MIVLSFIGFYAGIAGIKDVISGEIIWLLVLQLMLYIFGEMFFFLIIISLMAEVISIFRAMLFLKQLFKIESDIRREKFMR